MVHGDVVLVLKLLSHSEGVEADTAGTCLYVCVYVCMYVCVCGCL